MRYLDPKADLTFKRVFGENKEILISFLNALLPLEKEQEVIQVEYLSPEMVPDLPVGKNSIVDVRCQDNYGRQFIVEMQVEWTEYFRERVLFNSSKAYVRQLGNGGDYSKLKPVYCLSLVNAIFEKDSDDFYHHYTMVHHKDTNKIIEGLQLIFIELPKFDPTSYNDKKMQVLWLRFLTEIGKRDVDGLPEGLTQDPIIEQATEILKKHSFTYPELLAYDKFWDAVSTERTLINGKLREGLKEGMEKGLKQGMEKGMKKGIEEGVEKGRKEGKQEGIEEGIEKGKAEATIEIAKTLLKKGVDINIVALSTGFSVDELQKTECQ